MMLLVKYLLILSVLFTLQLELRQDNVNENSLDD